MHVTIIYRRFDNYGVDYREILRLDNLGYIKKDIASSIHSFRRRKFMSNSISFNSIIQHNEMIRKRNICCIYYGTNLCTCTM